MTNEELHANHVFVLQIIKPELATMYVSAAAPFTHSTRKVESFGLSGFKMIQPKAGGTYLSFSVHSSTYVVVTREASPAPGRPRSPTPRHLEADLDHRAARCTVRCQRGVETRSRHMQEDREALFRGLTRGLLLIPLIPTKILPPPLPPIACRWNS